jgi:hypothetical protein
MGDHVARPMVAHITIDRDRLRSINEALVRRCERFAMGRSRVLLELEITAEGHRDRRHPATATLGLRGGPGSEPDPAR